MASGFLNRGKWYIHWTTPAGQRRQRRAPDHIENKSDADALASMIQTAHTMAFKMADPYSIRFLRDNNAIDEQEAHELRGQVYINHPTEVTIREAFLQHPATARAARNNGAEFRQHERFLDLFTDFSGITKLNALTVQITMLWIEQMRGKGYSYDTRRHALIPLKRASSMGPSFQLVNILSGIHLDYREKELVIRFYSVDELARIIGHLSTRETTHHIVAFGLMGLMGLRPSEMQRAIVSDVTGNVLVVGERKRKTAKSHRTLPIPDVLLPHISRATKGRAGTEALVTSNYHPTRIGMPIDNLDKLVHKHIPQTGVRILPAKCFRKSFFSMCVNDLSLPHGLVEMYMGHRVSGLSSVSHNSYHGKAQTRLLEPVSEAVSKAITSCKSFKPFLQDAQSTEK